MIIKVGLVGDAQSGKTSLMVRYVEGSFDEVSDELRKQWHWISAEGVILQDYIQTLGVNFMEKTISIRNTEITFSIWDLGGQREFVNMLPLVCNDSIAILFMFDLTRKSTLNSIKEWYRQSRGFNKVRMNYMIDDTYTDVALLLFRRQSPFWLGQSTTLSRPLPWKNRRRSRSRYVSCKRRCSHRVRF